MPSVKPPQLYRLKFSRDDFLKLPQDDQLFFVQLGHLANDLRFISYMCAIAEKGTRSSSADERKLAFHQLHFGVRLLCSILTEAWKIITDTWNDKPLGERWKNRLTKEASDGLDSLHAYFTNPNLCRKIRNHFGFHYLREHIRGPLKKVPKRAAEIISGKRKRNIFYSFAEEVRSVAMLQLALPKGAPELWSQDAGPEDFHSAAKKLYTQYQPVLEAFEAFADCVLIEIIKSLRHGTEKFRPPKVTKWTDMWPILFVEEPD